MLAPHRDGARSTWSIKRSMRAYISISSTSSTNRWLLSARNALITLNTESMKPPMFMMSARSQALTVWYGCRSMQTSFGLASLPASLRWLETKASQAVITPVEPCLPAPTQLSLSLTRTMPANLRFECFWLAATSGSAQLDQRAVNFTSVFHRSPTAPKTEQGCEFRTPPP